MSHVRRLGILGVFSLLAIVASSSAGAEEIKTVFVIAMENHNWTQPANQFTGTIQQIFQNPNAPFINSLVDGTAFALVNGQVVHISEQVAFATNYHNVLATPSGNNLHIHPSEPNYLWAEAGDNFGVFNDNDPFAAIGGTEQNTTQHIVTLLTQAGKTWRSYQEDIDLTTVGGQLTNMPLPQDQWTVPLKSSSGTFAPGSFNQFNGSNQFNYAATTPWCSSQIRAAATMRPRSIRCACSTRLCSSCSRIWPMTRWPITTSSRRTSSMTCTPRSRPVTKA